MSLQKTKALMEYKRKAEEARARVRPRMPPAVAPVFVPMREIERAYCKPEEVKVDENLVTPEGATFVQLTCPKRGGATRERVFTRDETMCYFDALAKKEKPSECEKVDVALRCADYLTPTLTEQFTQEDVDREGANRCLIEKLDKNEVGAEHHWKEYRKFPSQPPRVTAKQLHDTRLGQYFAGEPIYSATPKTKEKVES
jgi:hypothetical protein